MVWRDLLTNASAASAAIRAVDTVVKGIPVLPYMAAGTALKGYAVTAVENARWDFQFVANEIGFCNFFHKKTSY